MKKILLFGAGKSASVLIDYLIKQSTENNWKVLVADANKKLVEEKTGLHVNSEAIELDINNEAERRSLVSQADIVISMMPASLHIMIAKDCIHFSKNLLTASYADDEILALNQAVKEKGILFLCEMGLDPGIDHMSAMQLLDEIKASGGKVNSFKSHCGGLVAPESDDNPWHYKITWNPRNVVLAGKAGAIYKEDGKEITEKYENLFDANRTVETGHDEVPFLSYYPNRNSLPYIDIYGLQEADTFIRTTLRYTDFMHGWKNIVDLKLTNEVVEYDSTGKTLKDFFKEQFDKNGFGNWLNELNHRFSALNSDASAVSAAKMYEASLFMKQLLFLGLEDDETIINKGNCSAADVLQFALEKKLALKPGDKDMIVMLHEIEYTTVTGNRNSVHSSLLVKGDDAIHTAMAKTVGLPLGIAAKLILNGQINMTGVQIPVDKHIYEPVLEELKNQGVRFNESTKQL